jgi:hypothetical protein
MQRRCTAKKRTLADAKHIRFHETWIQLVSGK